VPIVELLGASGVGKTFLVSSVVSRLAQPGKAGRVTGLLTNTEMPGRSLQLPVLSGFYLDLHEFRLRTGATRGAAKFKTNSDPLRYEKSLLQAELYYLTREPGVSVIADEMMLQHYGWFLADFLKAEPRKGAALLGSRNVIYVRDHLGTILSRYRARQDNGRRTPSMDTFTDQQLIESFLQFDTLWLTLEPMIIGCGGLCRKLDLETQSETAEQAIMTFLSEVEERDSH